MATEVVMPQMGESIVEGTLTKWLKKPGERVERDEPLFEISTDKVDTEIPSPAAGVLSETLVDEGKTVGINTVVARIQEGDGAGAQRRTRGRGTGCSTAAAARARRAPGARGQARAGRDAGDHHSEPGARGRRGHRRAGRPCIPARPPHGART